MLTRVTCHQCMSSRLPPRNAPGGLFNPKAFKNPAYTIYCLSSFFIYLGLYTGVFHESRLCTVLTGFSLAVLTFIDVSAVYFGISESFAFYLVAIANGTSGVGRYVCGYFSDKAGMVLIPF